MRRERRHKVRWSHYVVLYVLLALGMSLSLGSAATSKSDYGGIVRGRIAQAGEPQPNIKVTLEDELEQQYEPVFTNRDGVFVLTGVKPGKYKLLVWPPGGEPSKTDIIAGADITDLQPIELTGKIEASTVSLSPTHPPVSANSVTSEKAREFIRNFWAARQTGDLDRVMTAYAPRVDYYDEGVLDRDAIRKDQTNYLRYYTQRKFDVGAIDIIKGETTSNDNNPGTIRVRFSFRYRVSGKKQRSGSSVEDWLLGKADGDLQILDCKAKVMHD